VILRLKKEKVDFSGNEEENIYGLKGKNQNKRYG